MIPVRDEIRTHRVPVVNYLLILVNVLVFLWMYVISGKGAEGFLQYALIPSEISQGLDPGDVVSIFTSMFMHAGWLHLAGNMLYLWIFGDNIEDRLGHVAYLIFYLVGGVAAAIVHYLSGPSSVVPTVGASGAIAAVLGAYLVLYPHSRVYTFIPFGFFARLTLVPAVFVLGIWFVLQFFSGVITLGAVNQGGTAYWAHIGGFLFGLLAGKLIKRNRPQQIPAPPNWN